ncbi:aspartate aminotransferase family protein [Pseudoteredinibacter isoporae]|uniref:4-aminobutyrate aminotransferase-like enzyme n=1 Tax=Pseudoteredinibacter isoporae TaxID=570281 RepID=A0A7X0JPQ7_9GAMM|nr:aminotransferase class III-fold pyridoxal phosphate-dependent enzyme [Pseudoteredinibacter isoporae]MBB6520032.1 4-aminobutyrate aminotransferase-like enzyme [Pseudoteredinibacter isoporae]NHO85604.1 aminotransferase class III-fold pyridoxal phosphate-dependent enzyme [Pseudoteredinibacter isoporae]NIB25944.1 aminotransferase class III-fold pyridoxal phosphate-dependent enzyme [Pseudoteredinibacter isoporae]
MKNTLLERRNHLLGEHAPLFYDKPLTLIKGEGVWLSDAEGKRYLDVYNNVPNVGHCHPHVVEALQRQASQINVHSRYLHPALVEYGEQLTASFDPKLSMLFPTCSGSEANELALRMARQHTGNMGIICSNATYHGNTAAVDELATLFNGGEAKGPNVKAVNYPDSYRPLNGLRGEALTQAYVQQIKNTIAEFQDSDIGFAGLLFCPIFANEGLPDVPEHYMKQVAKLVRDAGGLLIFDEVQSGFGRTGDMWAFQHIDVVPDIVVLGKPMGNGHPLAGLVCDQALGKEFRSQVMYFNTFAGNPVSCAVGKAVLDVIENENLLENCRNVGGYLKQQLQQLSSHYEVIGDVRGSGLFFGVELVKDRNNKTPSALAAAHIVNRMKDRGVLISKIGVHDNILKMRPPICFGREHADILLNELGQVLNEVSREGLL